MIGHKVEQAVTVRALRGATPYIHMYKGKVFVIKTGGGAFRDAGTMRAFVEQVTILHENQSIYIPQGSVHRLGNPGKIQLEIIEIQTGSYLGEDDIIRISDEFGRA